MIDAIMGRYRVRMEEEGMILTHQSGISFDLTADEALNLYEFIGVYRKSLQAAERETEPELKRVIIEEHPQES